VKPWKGDLAKLGDLELAKLQAGRDEWQLRTARRVLQERAAQGRKLDEAAIGFLNETVKSHADPTRRLRALWCLEACGALDRRYVPAEDADESVRSWAVRLATAGEVGEGRGSWLDFAAKESSPVVLLSLCSSLQKLPPDLALDVAEKIAPKMIPEDPNLTRMFWFGFEALVPRDEKRALAIALSCPDERLVKWSARRLGSPEALIAAAGDAGGKTALLLEALLGRLDTKPDERLTPAQLEVLAKLGASGYAKVKEKADALSSRSGSREAIAKLWSQVEDRKLAVAGRLSALKLLVPSLGKGDDNRLAGLTDDPSLRLPVLMARPALIDHRATGDRVAGFTVAEKAALCRLAAREGKAAKLLEWLAAMKLMQADVPADAVARLREVKDGKLKAEIVKRWGEATADQATRRALIADWRGKLTPAVLAKADTAKGRAIYERTCAACHKLFGEGAEIGPELTGGQRESIDHWLDNILDPSALVGQGYELHQIEKNDGTTVIGMLAAENDSELILRMVGVETRVAKKDVKSNKALGQSMMPEGLLGGMSDEEVRNLIGYLMAPAQVDKH
jgi:putative heme-binding domain-containing protein